MSAPSWDDVEVGDTVTIEVTGEVTSKQSRGEVSVRLPSGHRKYWHFDDYTLKSVEKRASRTPADRALKPCDGSCWRTACPPVRTFKPGDVVKPKPSGLTCLRYTLGKNGYVFYNERTGSIGSGNCERTFDSRDYELVED